jgi:hypothetical protein
MGRQAGDSLGMSNNGVQGIGASKRYGAEVSAAALPSCFTIAPAKETINNLADIACYVCVYLCLRFSYQFF